MTQKIHLMVKKPKLNVTEEEFISLYDKGYSYGEMA
jgi:hypothetical protein